MSKSYDARHKYNSVPGSAKRHRVTVVAVQNEDIDWTAYIGATGPENEMTEEQAVEHVARHGCKLPEKVARAWFPGYVPAEGHGNRYRE